MTTQEILQLLDEKRVLTAPAAVAWDEVQRQQNRLNKAAKRLNGSITVTLALNLLFAFTIFLLEQSHLMHGFLLMLGLMGGLIAFKYFVFVAPAKQALANEGVQFPIHLDMPVDQTATTKVQRVQSMKQSLEATLGTDNVIIDIQQLQKDEVLNVTLFAQTAAGEDWDLSDNVGWGPDFSDPSTYLDIIKPSVGENTRTYLGFDSGKDNEAAKKVGLNDYDKMVNEAGEETTDVTKRYNKYAEAQAWLTDSALVIPTTSRTGRPILSKMVPFTLPFSFSGNKGTSDPLRYKYLELQDKAVTADEYQKAQDKWMKEKAESNKKVQEELAKHVK